jgi:hypothetical protein
VGSDDDYKVQGDDDLFAKADGHMQFKMLFSQESMDLIHNTFPKIQLDYMNELKQHQQTIEEHKAD